MLVNNKNTPEIMFDVIKSKPYIPAGASDYSATSMIDPPQIVQLKKRHRHEVEEDVLSHWNMFLGNAVHDKIEAELKREPNKYILERKFTEFVSDRKIVAKIDAFDADTNTLYDHKTCKTFAYSNDHKVEWEQQLNINMWFMLQSGVQVDRLYISALMLDWMAGMAKYRGAAKYPQNPMMLFDIPIWTEQEQEEFIKSRIDFHKTAETLEDKDLPECTEKEMWVKPASFAVKRKNIYVAKRVLETRKEAEAWIAKSRFDDLFIEERPGERVRCENYCSVNGFCAQYKKYKAQPIPEVQKMDAQGFKDTMSVLSNTIKA